MAGCQLEVGCVGAPTALVAVARRPTGATAYLTVVPAAHGRGGVLACAEHVHSAVDGMLMDGLGPMTPPARETIEGAQ